MAQERNQQPIWHHDAEDIVWRLALADRDHALGYTHQEIAARLGISVRTYLRWRRQYGGASLGQAQQIARLKREAEALRRQRGRLERGSFAS
ncbi:MAG: helix-turn-helix domain-containing protein [Hyphomonadaceae bacterium]